MARAEFRIGDAPAAQRDAIERAPADADPTLADRRAEDEAGLAEQP